MQITAAHPTLPVPSYARITNLANGRMIVVRINRSPFTAPIARSPVPRGRPTVRTPQTIPKVRIDPIIVAQDGSLSGLGTACTTVETDLCPARSPGSERWYGGASTPAVPAQPQVKCAISNDTLQSEDATGAPVKSSGFWRTPR